MDRVAISQHMMMRFAMEMGMMIITEGHTFSYVRRSYHQIRGSNLIEVT